MSNSLQILLVDDNKDTQRIFREAVDYHSQHQLHVVDDGPQALEVLKTYQPNIIIVDLFLPGLDGFQVLNRIIEDNLAPNANIIATTAYHTSDTYNDIFARGFKGLLAKPLQLSQLVKQLEHFAQ
jgi:CheY-like chemotaxis protein